MAVQPQEEMLSIVFKRGSPVHAYWVERCVGFDALDAGGRRLGRVRGLEREDDELVVARRFGSRRIATAAVQAVWPHERVILVSDEPHARAAERPEPRPLAEDTLPWFDLVGGGARHEPAWPVRLGEIRARMRNAGEAVGAALVRAARIAASASRRRARLVRAWAGEGIHDARRGCARALVRLAGMVEPRSHDA